jgi:CheY-like chemotaxis protein
VDDNVDAGDMLQVLLAEDGHTVTVVRDGESALQIAGEFRPEVVLLDIGLPKMDGYEVANTLRENFPRILLIAVSGWGQAEDRRKSKKAGFDHHLVKPIGIEPIKRLLEDASI